MLANNQKSRLGLVCMVNSFSLVYLEHLYLCVVADSGLEPKVKRALFSERVFKDHAILNLLAAEVVI